MDHWRYMQEVQSDADSEEYVYSGLGLVSNPSSEHLFRPYDIASDIDSIPRGSANRRSHRNHYQQPDLLRSLHPRLPQQQHGVDHLRERMNALPICPHCGGMLNRFVNDPQHIDQRGRNSLSFRSHREERNRGMNSSLGSLRPRSRMRPSRSISQSEAVTISSTSSQPSASSLLLVSDASLTNETLSRCSSCSTISTIHEDRMTMDSMPLLPETDAAIIRVVSFFRKSEKENYKSVPVVPKPIRHSSTDLSQRSLRLKSSLKQCGIIITGASDTLYQHKIIARYCMGRGYETYTDVPSSEIVGDLTINEKNIMQKIKVVFQKCMYVLCLLSKEYVERIKDMRSDCDPMHIRFFANLMEEEYKRNGRKNKRFLPIYLDSRFSKQKNMPEFLTNYPKDKQSIFQELVYEALGFLH